MISPETLRRFPLFAQQNDYMLAEIAMIAEENEYQAGQWLFHEKEDADAMYLVLDGAVELTLYLYNNGNGQHIRTTSPLRRGEIVGWSALVKPHLYTMGARLAEDSRLVKIDAGSLRTLLDDNPEFGYFLMKRIAEIIGEHLNFKIIQLLSLVLDRKGTDLEVLNMAP